MIDHGRKIAEGTSRELKVATGSGMLHVALLEPARLEAAAALLGARLGGAVQRSGRAGGCRSPASGRGGERGGGGAGRGRHRVADFSMGQPSLDEVFFALTGRADGPRKA